MAATVPWGLVVGNQGLGVDGLVRNEKKNEWTIKWKLWGYILGVSKE